MQIIILITIDIFIKFFQLILITKIYSYFYFKNSWKIKLKFFFDDLILKITSCFR